MGGDREWGVGVLGGVLWEFGVLQCSLESGALFILIVNSSDLNMAFEEDVNLLENLYIYNEGRSKGNLCRNIKISTHFLYAAVYISICGKLNRS